jgi:hypothetical protein
MTRDLRDSPQPRSTSLEKLYLYPESFGQVVRAVNKVPKAYCGWNQWDELPKMGTSRILIVFVHFGTGSAFELGSNGNRTSRTRSGAFGPRFDHMAEREPAFSSAFANFAQEPDWTGLRQHYFYNIMMSRNQGLHRTHEWRPWQHNEVPQLTLCLAACLGQYGVVCDSPDRGRY